MLVCDGLASCPMQRAWQAHILAVRAALEREFSGRLGEDDIAAMVHAVWRAQVDPWRQAWEVENDRV